MEDEDDSFDSFVKFKKEQHQSNKTQPSEFSEPEKKRTAGLEQPPAQKSHDPLEAKANYELLFALDAWYEQLREHTAATRFVPLSPQEVIALLRPDEAILRDLEARIDSELVHFKDGAFCKLQTRSPKDVVARLGDPMLSLVRQRMAKTPLLATAKQKRLIANDDANLISTLARELFKVQSGKEVVELFQKSDRVQSDLEKARSADRGSVLVLRKFSLCLPEYEFRAFVYKRQLTGVSQYCYSQFFPHMLVRRTEIEKAIVQFFKETMRLYPMDNFVCDVFLTWPNDTSLPKVEIIELNPFFNDTGALLFSWKSARDRDVLGGRAGLTETQFRYLEQPVEDPYDCLPIDWRSWFEQQRKMK